MSRNGCQVKPWGWTWPDAETISSERKDERAERGVISAKMLQYLYSASE